MQKERGDENPLKSRSRNITHTSMVYSSALSCSEGNASLRTTPLETVRYSDLHS